MKSKRKFTVTHRALHWSVGIMMLLLFITGFLHMYWMGKKHMADLIAMGTKGLSLTKEQLFKIAGNIRAPMWQWHIYAAYVIAGLFGLRIGYMLIKGSKFPQPFRKKLSLKERLESSSYILFYIFMSINIITGFYILWGSNSHWHHLCVTVHIWAIYWFPIFIVIHFGGVLIGEITSKKGVTSKMIGGGS